jgi:hypothetical protein
LAEQNSAGRSFNPRQAHLFQPCFTGTFYACRRSISRHQKENVMNSIVWLVGAVVIVIAVLNLVGFA